MYAVIQSTCVTSFDSNVYVLKVFMPNQMLEDIHYFVNSCGSVQPLMLSLLASLGPVGQTGVIVVCAGICGCVCVCVCVRAVP